MFEIKKVEPVGTRTYRALVKRASGPCTLDDVTEPAYPPSPQGENLRRTRVASAMSVRELAKALGIGVVDLSAVEHGRAVFVDANDWDRALALAATSQTAGKGGE